MAVVASYRFFSDDPNAARFALEQIRKWADSKFVRGTDGLWRNRRFGTGVTFFSDEIFRGEEFLTQFDVSEPVDGAVFHTRISIVFFGNESVFQVMLSVSSTSGLNIPNVNVQPPKFVKMVLDRRPPWSSSLSGELIHAFVFNSKIEYFDELDSLVFSDLRRLPVILVSKMPTISALEGFAERIEEKVCGLAHVISIDEGVSWKLTNLYGREWSCFNGAVRIFWPLTEPARNFRAHPLWTADNILSRQEIAEDSIKSFIMYITRYLMRASTYIGEDAKFAKFRELISREQFDLKRQLELSNDDFRALADSYALENDRLRSENSKLSRENVLLQSNNEALVLASRTYGGQASSEVDGTFDEMPPATVEEAVDYFINSIDVNVISVAREVRESIRSLNPIAGPPEKVLRYLLALKKLAEFLNSGENLGSSVPIWLRKAGVECSRDSETQRKSSDGGTVLPFNGERSVYHYHAKPSDAVSPDRCVRIYFNTYDTHPFVKIAYIGRHF